MVKKSITETGVPTSKGTYNKEVYKVTKGKISVYVKRKPRILPICYECKHSKELEEKITASGDTVQSRKCHHHTDANTNGIQTKKNNMFLQSAEVKVHKSHGKM